MIDSFKQSIRLYTRKFEGVTLLSLTVLFPLLIINWYILNVVYAFVFNDFTSALADFYYILLTFIFLVLAQIPFIRFVQMYEEEGEIRYKDIYRVFIINAFSLFLFGIILSLLTSVGALFFIIPGLIVLTFFFTAPYEAILERKSVWKSVKTSIQFAKKKFFPLLIIILLVSFTELIIGGISTYLIYSISSSLLAQILVQMLLNIVIFPFLVIWVTYYFRDWKAANQLA